MHSPDRLDVQAGRQAGNGSMICKPNERSTAFVYDVRCTLYVWLYADVYKWITRVLNGSNQQRCYALASTSVMHPIKANRERTEFTFHRRFRAQANRIAGWASWEWNKKILDETNKKTEETSVHSLFVIKHVPIHIRGKSTHSCAQHGPWGADGTLNGQPDSCVPRAHIHTCLTMRAKLFFSPGIRAGRQHCGHNHNIFSLIHEKTERKPSERAHKIGESR